MFCSLSSVLLVLNFAAVNLIYLYLRYLAFYDYFECFACKELNTPSVEYDYIVVGSGSAGSIVARRLAEDKSVRVLIVEAGSYGNSLLEIPFMGVMLQDSVFDWQYRTVPQKKACRGLKHKKSRWPMGKGFGGSSIMNNMIYTRGHIKDYETWYQNHPNFNYTVDILPYFKKLESYNTYNSKKSIVISESLPFMSNISHDIIASAECSGFSTSSSIYSELGFSFPRATLNNGHRWTSANQMLLNQKPNLVLLSNSYVEKVLFKGNYEAYGVKYSHVGDEYVATASKGIILSAGAIGSPKVLLLSGIGPKWHLKRVKINPVIDLPVGENLQDHVTTGTDLILMETAVNIGLRQLLSPYSLFEYFWKSQGPWTTIGCEVIAFFHLKSQEVPDLQFMMLPLGLTSDKGHHLRSLLGVADSVWDNYFARINKTSLTILPVVLHPKSRGTVRLKNSNPETPPLIDPKYLTDKYDVEVLIGGIEKIKELIGNSPLKKHGAHLNGIPFPGCGRYEFDTRPYWECYVKSFTLTSYHPVGTCSMGKVVDYNFQVMGTNKLYVVDGSILPALPSGNPNAAIMMMAEKAVDVLVEQRWSSQKRCHIKDIFIRDIFC